MLYWGKLHSTEDDSTHQRMDNDSGHQKMDSGFSDMFRATGITDVCMREGLVTFLRDKDGKVTVVTSHESEF